MAGNAAHFAVERFGIQCVVGSSLQSGKGLPLLPVFLSYVGGGCLLN